MLRWRLISAAITLSVIILLIWLDVLLGRPSGFGRPGLVLFGCMLVVGTMAASEVLWFNQKENAGVRSWAVYLGTWLVIGLAFVPAFYQQYPADCPVGRLGWPMFGMAAATGLAFLSQMFSYRTTNHVMDNVARTVMVVAYIGLLMSFWAPLRATVDNLWGMVALLSMFVTVKLSDIMAYTIGKLMGRNKMAPNLSPGKTVEGMVGGFIGGCLGALLVFYLLAPQMTGESSAANWWQILVFGIVVTAAGILGDLSESLLKRDGGVKNSSRWLPGLGGIMDMVDSPLAAGPVVFAFWATGWFGPAGL